MYSLTKGALQSEARSIAIELAPKEIRVNCIASGAIVTSINEKLPHMVNLVERASRSQASFGFRPDYRH
ncbi:SDR family oxidoreductase [uncultured Parabacteroides sp.]|uniref:SDR family oxidoreductase n=1 Tax=uncultured Parabacteroides sp. TaxID=512312 RepID=UPI0034671E58